jgi:hypothetical protein
LIMSLYLRPFFIFHLFSQSGVVDLRWGTYILVFLRIYACKGTCMSNVWAYFYMMNSSFKGWHVVVMIAWWTRILILPKLHNKNFLSDDHCVTHKSWIQDASRRACLDAKKYVRSIHPKSWF